LEAERRIRDYYAAALDKAGARAGGHINIGHKRFLEQVDFQSTSYEAHRRELDNMSGAATSNAM
jgi:hypothetical protein